MTSGKNDGSGAPDKDPANEPDRPSTTFVWKRAKMSRAPQASVNSQPKAGISAFRRLPPWPWRRKSLHLTVTYRGGSECWFEIHARGHVLRRPGYTALVDVVKDIANQDV